MTASVGQEVDANLLRGAAPGSAQTRAEPQDSGGQNLGDLVEPFGGGHQVGVERFRHGIRDGVADGQFSLFTYAIDCLIVGLRSV
jgi:hypothetical protein